LVTRHCFSRDYLQVQGDGTRLEFAPKVQPGAKSEGKPGADKEKEQAAPLGAAAAVDPTEQAIYLGVTERALGLPVGALRGGGNVAQAATLGVVPPGTTGPVAIATAPVTVNPPCDDCKAGPLARLLNKLCRIPKVQTNVVLGTGEVAATEQASQSPGGIVSPGGSAGKGVVLPSPGNLTPSGIVIPPNPGMPPAK
jgi:hypothetical protein